MGNTKIEWASKVWNPTTGCTKVSQGCRYCFAERMANRFWKERKFTEVMTHPDRLEIPLHWRKPQRVFVDSMSDLFHPDVPDEFIREVFFVMYLPENRKHTFMILTKRPERMARMIHYTPDLGDHIWLGVSVEDQKTADERIPLLLQTQAAVRFISAEPLLGPIELQGWDGHLMRDYLRKDFIKDKTIRGPLDWVICGGESGPNARPMHPDWARSLRDQCQAANVKYYFKQWGEWLPDDQLDPENRRDPMTWVNVGKKIAGNLLDGQIWMEYPESS